MINTLRDGIIFKVLNEHKLEGIYFAAMEVLRRTGINVGVAEALELYKKAGCMVDGNRVRIPTRLIQNAVDSVPKRVTVCDRNGNPAMYLEGHNAYFGTGGDCANVIDLETGERRDGTYQDTVNFAKLVDTLPNIDFVMNMPIARDLPQSNSDLFHFKAMLENTTKPIIYSAWNVANLDSIIKICDAVSGSHDKFLMHPFAVFLAAEVSPLQITSEYAPLALYAAEKGIPQICGLSAIAGATAPITLAGAMTQALAEQLNMLLLSQLKNEGTPMIFHCAGPIPLDMSTLIGSYSSPEFVIFMAAMTEMAHFLGLPVFSFGGCSDSKIFDEQASLEGAMSMLVSAMAGGNLIHDVGYVEYGLTASLEMLTVMDEVAGFVKHMLGGVEVNPDTLLLNAIDEVGPGGDYLSHPSTLARFRSNWRPEIIDRQNYGDWDSTGRLTLGTRAKNNVRNILESHRPEPLEEELKATINEIIKAT